MGRKLPYFFHPQEKEVFLKACEDNPRNHAIFQTLFDSGMRISELVGDKRTGYRGLYFEDINFESDPPEIRVHGKGDQERVVIISSRAVQEILSFLGDRRSGRIFDITPRMVQKLARKYAKEAGLPDWDKRGRWSPHKARHTHITEIVSKTHDLAAAQEQAGHKPGGYTSIYLHLDTEYRKPVMKKVFGETERKYACLRCGDPFEALPPDDRRTIATRLKKDYKDNIKVEYECPKCGLKNVLYWGDRGADITAV